MRSARGQLEGFDLGAPQTVTGYTRLMAWYDRLAAPERSGSFLPQYPSQTNCTFPAARSAPSAICTQQAPKSYMFMDMPLNQYDIGPGIMGTAVITSGVAGDTWNNVALEFDEFLLD